MRFTIVHILIALTVFTGCAQNTATKKAVSNGLPLDISGANESTTSADAGPNAPLIYAWQTGFSGFISAPIEVRRAAYNDCLERGMAVAVMASLSLEGDSATAEFTCRGDTE